MIPKIIKGKGITGALKYVMSEGYADATTEGTANDNQQKGRYKTLEDGEQSRARLLGGQNFGFEIDSPERLELARRMMEWQGLPENQAGKTRKLDLDCFHASLSWEPGQQPTDAEMSEAAGSFLKAVGLENARAIFVRHDDTDHQHLHIVASRIDPETGQSLRMDYDKKAAQVWALDWEQAHGQQRQGGQDLHGLRAAIEQRDAAGVLDHVTRNQSTFQPWQIDRALEYGKLSKEEAASFRADILANDNVIGLREGEESTVSRYTTRAVVLAEKRVERSAGTLAADAGHGVKGATLDKVSADHTLTKEQDAALRHMAQDSGFAMLWGEAGTGKSHTLNAARAAYEAEGKEVIGLSWTNKVVQQMRGDGFEAATIASELNALAKGRKAWSRNSVVIVDEAAMVSTDSLSKLFRAAEQSGAKLILAGDDKQLASVERGGMFETLRERYGAATLKDVQRVNDAEQQAGFNEMHEGKFAKALGVIEERGGLHWTKTQGDALRNMASAYAAAVEAAPEKSRFMFAYTNKEVDALNAAARDLYRQRGALGEDHRLQTSHGAQAFATGDRIQFTGNAWTKAEKDAGLVNGNVGAITALEQIDGRARLTVALDEGKQARTVSFFVGDDARNGEFNGFRHGWAGSIFKTQGRTLDESFMLFNAHARRDTNYVGLSRHRESVQLFAAREDVADLDAMARLMAREPNKRAATAYHIDEAQLARMEAALAAERPQEAQAPAPDLTAGAAEALDKVADYAERAIDTLANALESLLGGGSSAPAKQPPRPMTAHEKQVAEFLERERAESARRKAALQELSRQFGRELNEEEAREIEKTRDRGGGQSL